MVWTYTGVLGVGEAVRVCFMTGLVGQFIVTDQIEISSLRAGASVNLLSFGKGRVFRGERSSLYHMRNLIF